MYGALAALAVVLMSGRIQYTNAQQSAACTTYTTTNATDPRYAPPYNVVPGYNGNFVSIVEQCNPQGMTLRIGNASQPGKKTAVYKNAYVHTEGGASWVPLTQITNAVPLSPGSDWYDGGMTVNTGSLSGKIDYLITYICVQSGSEWKCGCKNAACTDQSWHLQAFNSSGTGGGSLEFKMDADGPGPMAPQEGTVSSKLLMLRRFTSTGTGNDLGNQYYLTGVPIHPRLGEGEYDCIGSSCMVTATVNSSYVADLSWSSSATSCTLSQKLPQTNDLLAATFDFSNLPGSGRARVLIPLRYRPVVQGQYESGNPEYTINCGGVRKTIIATFPSFTFEPAWPPLGSNAELEKVKLKEAKYNAFIAAGGKSIQAAELAVGPAKVDAKAVVSARRTVPSPGSGCQGGQCGGFTDMVLGEGPMANLCTSGCAQYFVYTSINVPACTYNAWGSTLAEQGPHLYKIWRFVALNPDFSSGPQTVTCGNASDTVN